MKIFDKIRRLSQPFLVISETSTSTWHYHLRQVGPEGLKLSGGAPPAICGAELGWDTKMPLTAWGVKSHVPYHFCRECAKKAQELGLARLAV